MAIYRVNVGNREYVVDVTENQVMVDGKPIQASLTPLNNGGLVLLRKENRNARDKSEDGQRQHRARVHHSLVGQAFP